MKKLNVGLVGVHGDDAPGIGLLGGFRHGLGVLQGGGDGLLAEHVLYGVQGGNGDLGVGVVGGAHAHHVDLRVVDDVPPVGAALLIAKALPGVGGDLGDDVANGL